MAKEKPIEVDGKIQETLPTTPGLHPHGLPPLHIKSTTITF